MVKTHRRYLSNKKTRSQSRKNKYPLTVQRFLKSSLSGNSDSGENLKVST
jgi:hypothetical protein